MLTKFITNLTKNFKTKKNTSSLFNNDSNPINKISSISDDFIDITKDSVQNNFNQKLFSSNSNQKDLLNNFIKNITSIIFDSRRQKINDSGLNKSINSNKTNTSINSNDNSFNLEIDDLFLYDDYYQEKKDFQKLIIEFYLTKKTDKKITIRELVEKWKLSYNSENDNSNDKNNLQKIKNKMTLYIKSIISYSRLLPLYQYIISNDNNNYSIDFKFYQNDSNKKGKFSHKFTGNVLLKNQDVFNIKTNIQYYTLKELKNIFEQKEKKEIDINKPDKIKSLLFNEKYEFEDLNELSKDNKNINNKLNNDENFTQSDKNEIKDLIHDSNNSSFCLIFDSQEEKNEFLNIKDTMSKRKFSSLSNGYETTEDCSPRNSYMKNNYRTCDNNNEETISLNSNSTNKSFIKTQNNKINNILKEYTNVRDMIENLNSNIYIRTNKFINYAKGCD